MTRLLSELKESARLSSGKLTIEPVTTDLSRLVSEVVSEFGVMTPERRFETEIQPGLSAVVDPGRIEQVLHNLLSNACKYSPAESAVAVVARRAESDPASIRLAVRDRGQGIEPREAAYVFERFFQARGSARGLGLGLYISREIVRQHGGTISVESEPGKGSTFTIELPAAGPTAKAAA
jgi:signal transduction histidine kinase